MTNRYEAALNELRGYSYEMPEDLWETVISAIKLAQEAEQHKEQREAFKAKMDAFLEEDITRTKTVDGAIVGFIYRDDLIKQLRKERDELARAIIKIHEDQEGDYDFLKFISHPQYILAKKVAGE